jgi:transcriptional regulator with XRE-family HTH domain
MEPEEISRVFGQRTKAARMEAGLTQAQLQDRLASRGIKIDSSGLTRIEAGQREPRLSEALALADVLGFGLANLLTPAPGLETYMNEVRRLMGESRETLLQLLRSVDKTTDLLGHK